MAVEAPVTPSDESADPLDDTGDVQIVDFPDARTHLLPDLVRFVVTLVGIVLVLLLGAYASGTTAGITSDVQGFYGVLHRLLVAPVNILEGAVTLVLPIVVVLALAMRREPRRILEALAGLCLGIAAVLLVATATRHWGAPELISSLSVTANGLTAVTMPAYLAGLAAMLTTAGRRRVLRPVSVSWTVLWLALAVAAISGFVTLPAALSTVLIGRAAGLLTRYTFGTPTDRAYGGHLVHAIRRAGFEPKRLVRVENPSEYSLPTPDPACLALARTHQGRVYDFTTVENHHLVAVALDGDRVAAGSIAKIWRSLRVRGIDSRPDLNLRRLAESTALVSHAARTAGVRTARVLGMAQSRDTMVIVYQRPMGCHAFADLTPEDATDEVLDAIWTEILKAHHAGITHRELTSDTVLICPDEGDEPPAVWLSGWQMGEVASGSFSKAIDMVQLVAMIAAKVGAQRAVQSAFRALPEAEIAAFAPFLQAVLLPRPTRIETKARGHVLRDVRAAILERLPEAPTVQQRITRFSLRTVFTLIFGVFAAYAILTSFNVSAVVDAIGHGSPFWVAIVFGLSATTYVGATLALLAYSPVKLPFMTSFIAQFAASFKALIMPAGLAPAVVNHQLLSRRGVPRPLAVATVALIQVSGIVATVLGLVVLSFVAGDSGALIATPSPPALIAVGSVAIAVTVALAFPKVRAWVGAKVKPIIRQTWPRLVSVLARPWTLALGLTGNLLMTTAYVGAFWASLQAFGQQIGLVQIAIIYLLGSAAGTAVPTPGGLGAIEVTLTTLLLAAGVPAAIAGSAVILFRGVTYGSNILIGYVAMKYLQNKGELSS
jgi:uncharacterized protein (TIRG00374 family)